MHVYLNVGMFHSYAVHITIYTECSVQDPHAGLIAFLAQMNTVNIGGQWKFNTSRATQFLVLMWQ